MNANNLPIQYWKVRSELASETEEHYRDKIVSKLAGQSPMKKVKIVTFDGVAPRITQEDTKSLLGFINLRLVPGVFTGTGLEVGAGTGFFSALLASMPQVKEIYAVEVSRPIVEGIMPEIARSFSEGNISKFKACVGDFSYMEVPDASVDFIFDFFSLHHSDDLFRTFSEMERVLRPGGKIICLDKARADRLSDADLESLLDKEYSADMKKFMGIDPGIKWTRRMNGEREFRLRDWQGFAEAAGLSLGFFSHVAMTRSPKKIYRYIKDVFSLLPIRLELILTKALGFSSRKHPNQLETKNLIFSPTINNFPKEISLMIFSK